MCYYDDQISVAHDFLEVKSVDMMGKVLVVKNEYGVKFGDPFSMPLKVVNISMATGSGRLVLP